MIKKSFWNNENCCRNRLQTNGYLNAFYKLETLCFLVCFHILWKTKRHNLYSFKKEVQFLSFDEVSFAHDFLRRKKKKPTKIVCCSLEIHQPTKSHNLYSWSTQITKEWISTRHEIKHTVVREKIHVKIVNDIMYQFVENYHGEPKGP